MTAHHAASSSQFFESLTWDDIVTWVGSKIADRGRKYQRQGRVKGLVLTDSGALLASVLGSEPYVVHVSLDDTGGLVSHCTCPYGYDCKHGVATLLEYISSVNNGRQIPLADPQDERLEQVHFITSGEEDWETISNECGQGFSRKNDVETLLNAKTKAELITILLKFAETVPEVETALLDMAQRNDGDIVSLTKRLLHEIRRVSSEAAWQHHWDGEGHIPDYSGIRDRLEALLADGYADEVLALGKELADRGIRQIETSDDEGETAVEISSCLELLPHALELSSLAEPERIVWALDRVLLDPFDICSDLAAYLRQEHPASAWDTVANRLLKRMNTEDVYSGDFSSAYRRDSLTNWIIHALEKAGRDDEILSLCEDEAPRTNSYVRLVKRLIALKRYEDAENWIGKGLAATDNKYPGIASQLRESLLEIRSLQEDWPSVILLHVEAFVRNPSVRTLEDCKDAANHLGAWPKIRQTLLDYLAHGQLPWKHSQWPLLAFGKADAKREVRGTFPQVHHLLNVALHENDPEEVLRWYALYHSNNKYNLRSLDDNVATAIATYAPDQAVAIWKNMAEQKIDQVTQSAYQEAGGYLRKAAKIMVREKKEAEWTQYLTCLRETHYRKKRLLEVLDTLNTNPLIKKRTCE